MEAEEYNLYTDGVLVCTSSTVIWAMACFICSFYVFNLAISISCRKTMTGMTFILKCFLNTKDSETLNRLVFQLLEKLHKFVFSSNLWCRTIQADFFSLKFSDTVYNFYPTTLMKSLNNQVIVSKSVKLYPHDSCWSIN